LMKLVTKGQDLNRFWNNYQAMESEEICRKLVAKDTGHPPNCAADALDLFANTQEGLSRKEIHERLPNYKRSTIYLATSELQEKGYIKENSVHKKSKKPGRPDKNFVRTEDLYKKYAEFRNENLNERLKQLEDAKLLTSKAIYGMGVQIAGPQEKEKKPKDEPK
jgi:predicted transcriptional regulator